MPIQAPPTVDDLPTPPNPDDRSTFNARAYPWSVAQQTFKAQVTALADNVHNNATEAKTQADAAALSKTGADTAKGAAEAARDLAEQHKNAAATSAADAASIAAGNLAGTSTDNRTPAVGAMTFAYADATGKTPKVGMRMRAASAANPANNFAAGTVTAYAAPTITVSVDYIGSAPAAAADWVLTFGEGSRGAQGSDGAEAIAAAATKATPVDADSLALVDSAASNALKRLTWANLKAAVWTALGGLIAGGTSKATPVDADTLALSDSAASNGSKKLTWANLKATLKAYFDPLYAPGWTLLSSQTVSSAVSSVNFTSALLTSAYDFYVIVVSEAQPSASSTKARFRFLKSNLAYATCHGSLIHLNNTTTAVQGLTVNQTDVPLVNAALASASYRVSGTLELHKPTDTTGLKRWLVRGVQGSGTNSMYITYGGGATSADDYLAITQIEFSFDSGNVVAGTVCLYGVKK